MSQLLQDQLLDMGAKPLPNDLSQTTATVAAARAVAGWQSNKRVLPLVPEFKHVVNVRGSFPAASMQGLQVGCKLPASWEVPASANVDPCFVSSVPQGSKILRILTVPGEMSEDAPDNLSAAQAGRVLPSLSAPPEDAHPAEKLACIMLQWNTRFSQEEMRTLLDMLPQKHQTRARGSCDEQSNQFLCGAYAHGPMTGCKNLTRDMPWCTAVLCKHVRDNAPGFCFSAVGYLCNVRAEAHRDLHNEPGTKNLVMATHDCAGGGLWLEEAGGPVAMVVDKTQRAGRFHDLAVGRPFIFEPKRWHATQPWRGDRGVIVAYTPVGVTKLATADKGFLENLGFPLGTSSGSSDVPPRVAKVQKGSIVFGVYHEPEEFVARALSVQHPCHLESLLPSELVEAIRANHSKDVATLGRERTEMLKKWLARAEELETAEKQLKGSFSSHRRQVLCNKRLLLMKEMLDSVGHEDEDLISDLSNGFDLTGPLPRSNAFKNKYRPAAMAEETLRKSAGLVRGQVLASVKSSGDEIVDRGVLAATEKELSKGFIEGPVCASDIPADGTVTHRFGVIQGETEEGPKVRPIDNYLSSLVNSVVSQSEQVPVHTLDVVAGMLAMWLHLSPLKSLREGLVCKCWDLSAAYKQLPLSDKSFEKDSFFVIYCPRTRQHVIYKQRVMPFGAKASVTAFIRCAFGIWRLGVKMFALVWSFYFDDFLSACKPEERRHVEVVISTLFRILGWDLSLDKLLPYDVCCKVLGIKIDMAEARLGLFKLANTEKRVMELTAALDEVLLAERLSHSDCEKLRGRLQFASGQLFGRRAKVALHQLSRHHGGRLSEATSKACRFLRRLVSSNQSRLISRQLGNVVHVYVDASFSDEGKLCGIGGMAYDHKGSLLQWFGENLDASLVSQVMTSFERVKETVIFELEALAVHVALKCFFKALKGKNVVVFTDNEGVHGAFVKCWTVSQFATHVIDAVCEIEESLGFMIWYDRVPSASVLAATEKELAKGFIEGPVSASDIPNDGTVTHRVGVIQGETEEGPKVRPIDNYLSSLVNSVVSQSEQVLVHTLDVVAGMLAMWLHLSPLKSLRTGLVCKCWDLSAAYKQLPLSDKSFEKDSFFVIFCPRTRKHVIYKQRVMPFGAKASVTAFIRCAFGIWRLGVKMFALVWSFYFDDFLSACKPEERRHVEVVISTLFRLLGWDLSLDKLLPYDVCCKVLGIKIDMAEARLGLFKLANTEKRVLELTAALDEVLLAGRLSHSDCERLRGRLQFASGQLFGRRAKVALRQLSRHHGGRLSEVTSEACRFLRRLVSSNQSRSISRQLGNVVHVYVDASFSDEGKLCGIGGMAYDHKGSLLQWFGENLDASLVSQVMTSFERVKETVIFELEALAVYVALKFFFKALKGKNVVVFTDSEGVHGAFVKCWTVSQFASHVIDAVCEIEESLGFMIWYDRDGGGIYSCPDWTSPPTGMQDIFRKCCRFEKSGKDRDTALWPALQAGVATGVDGDISLSNCFLPTPADFDPNSFDVQICSGNWPGANEEPELLAELVQQEVDAGYLLVFDSLEEAQKKWSRIAIGKVNVIKSPNRKPRLIVDPSVSGVNPSCHIPERFLLPGLSDIRASYPMRGVVGEVEVCTLDIAAAHKTVRIRESEQGLLGFSVNGRYYFYRVAPFGGSFSALWWQRLSGFYVRTCHRLIYISHIFLMYVDDALLLQHREALPLSASLVLTFSQSFGYPISWRKLQLGPKIEYIGWLINFRSGSLSLTDHKVAKLLTALTQLAASDPCNKRDLQAVIGMLHWVLQMAPSLLPWLCTLYHDLARPLGTNFSLNAATWQLLPSYLDAKMIFTATPPGTSIKVGSRLLSVRHVEMLGKQDLAKVRCTGKRLWARVADPSSTKRKLSLQSRTFVEFWMQWCIRPQMPRALSFPPLDFSYVLAADACAKKDDIGIGGWVQLPNQPAVWFVEKFKVAQFRALGLPVQDDANLDITSYETLAQLALLICFASFTASGRMRVKIPSWSDNSGTESVANKLFTVKTPLCFFAQKLATVAWRTGIVLDCSRIAGCHNDKADWLSRWSGDVAELPATWSLDHRVKCDLPTLWEGERDVRVFPPGATFLWEPPKASVGR
ncbi:unnamed protein product [Symbiodinium sp. CCMP2592]|nr:unnamed protein product [Symbiodinium sp. CCMP2592]